MASTTRINEPGGLTAGAHHPERISADQLPLASRVTSASTGTRRTPYVQQWSASFQHEAAGHVLVEIAYMGTKGTDLPLFRRFNTPAQVEIGADLPPRPGDLQSLRTFPELGTLFQIQHIG